MHLQLSGLATKTKAELIQTFKDLPANLTSLDLRGNEFYNRTGIELAQAFKALPASLASLNLSQDDFSGKSDSEAKLLFSSFAENVQTIIFDDRTLNLDEFRAERKLETQFTRLAFQLLVLKDKVEEFKSRKCSEAYHATNILHETLTELKNQYSEQKINYIDFKIKATWAINTARIDLEKQRGWKELLTNLSLCILGFGIGYLAICAYKGSFFKVNTDSTNKLNDLQRNIDPDALSDSASLHFSLSALTSS